MATLIPSFIGLIFISGIALTSCEIEVVHQWNLLPFELPHDYPINGGYIPQNIVFTGTEVGWSRIFLAIPRLRLGIPATLVSIPRTQPGVTTSPVVSAYPNWDFHSSSGRGVNCSGLISTYRIRADRCNRLWVLDSGVSNSIDDFTTVCPPKILIFDMSTDQLVKSVTFPREVIRPASLFTNLVIDDLTGYGSCDDAFVYISDTAAPGIVVYDARKDAAWRFSHPSMYPNPDYSTYTIADESFTLTDGIIGLALSPPSATASRVLYYQPLATDRIFSVPVSFLQAGPSTDDVPVQTIGRKSSQGVGLAVDPHDGSIYFSPIEQTAVASWQPGTNRNQVLAYDPEILQFVSELLVAYRDNGNLWLLSTRFQKFFKRTVDPREINLRIMRLNTADRSIIDV
ncbi:major royal jelly protein 4 precursor, putative [Pediculus humanus corporis]|uniref:Major royal jelly protein 4, putative n=1 Tax=Pediculus humanus subsp. corporis TaxID=121224 RepID=E0VTB1_PEDHC|nr:major royal jelly protein 4 precursor, putative [Pediculus humanus corporis]EEB16617.1 major royal jelly protein 4 precursor, putative [Pediculus humanus corporis]